MQGKNNIRFSDLFTDTIEAHGYFWALHHYTCKNNMSYREFKFWIKATGYNGA